MSIPIYCINLERATERKEAIKKIWVEDLGFDINFWKAYDRRDIDNKKFIYPYDEQKAISVKKRPLSNGEIACATSFCMLYEFLIRSGCPEAIVMEDDIVPSFTSKQVLFDQISICKNEFPEAQLVLLQDVYGCGGTKKKHEPDIFYIKKDHFSMCKIPPWGNQLFYITIEGAQKTYNILKTIFVPADYPQKILAQENIVCVSNKPLCYHLAGSQGGNTYIGYEYRNKTKNRTKPFIE